MIQKALFEKKPAPQFKLRARVVLSAVSQRKIYYTTCGMGAVVAVKFLLGSADDKKRVEWQAMRCVGGTWVIVSRNHRKRGPAEIACLEELKGST
jgi:hypothetical protein